MPKTYKAPTMFEALELVQRELGSDAIVLSARDVQLGPAWSIMRQSGVEVVAMASNSLPGQTAQKQPKETNAVLRQSEDGSSVEFVEDPSQIEWVSEPSGQVEKTHNKPTTPAQDHTKEAQRWTPKYISKKETLSTNKSEFYKVQENAPRQAVVKEVKETKPSLAELKLAKPERVAIKSPSDLPAALQSLRRKIIAQGLDEGLIDRMLDVAIETYGQSSFQDEKTGEKCLSQLLEAELRVQKGLGIDVPSRIMCLVGASGSGKTSTGAKLAVFFSQKLDKKVVWVSTDTVRTGAIAETKAYTDALGVNLKLIFAPSELKEVIASVLASVEPADLVIVDTPGYNPLDEAQMVELGALLTEIPRRSTYLVTAATTKENDLYQIAASLGIFSLNGLIVTKMDETFTHGSVYNFARKSQLCLSYFTTGKDAISNLEVANGARLVSALFGKGWRR
jgi:flagellar biosynthesis protein FlhF